MRLGLAGVFWDVHCGKFDFEFLSGGEVGGGSVEREFVEEVLRVLLVDFFGKRGEGAEEMVAYGEGLLGFGG